MAGLDPATFTGKAKDVRPLLIEAGRQSAAKMELDVSGLCDDQMVDDYHYMIFPNVTFNIHALGVMVFRQRPHPTDPNRMFFDLSNYSRATDAPPRPEHTHHLHGDVSLGLVLDQDAYNLPRVQKGMQSRAYEGLHISYPERRIRHMHQTLDGYLFGGGDGTRIA